MKYITAIKSDAGEWILDVLAIPFGGRDSDDQYFDEDTDIMPEVFKSPVIIYYHGINPDNRGVQKVPLIIGKTLSVVKQADGWHVRVILDKAQEYARRIWEAAKKGLAAASSGSIAHLARLADGSMYDKRRPGRIAVWPLAELSLIDIGDGRAPANRHAIALPALKSIYQLANMSLPEIDETQETEGAGKARSDGGNVNQSIGEYLMDEKEKEVQAIPLDVTAQINAAIKADREARELEAKQAAEVAELAAVKAENETLKTAAAEANRLPSNKRVVVAKYANTWAFDNLEPVDHALMYGVLKSAGKKSTDDSLQALAIKISEADNRDGTYNGPLSAMKAAGMPIKANELNQSTLASYGDEWVGVTYSSQLWEKIVNSTEVAGKLPTVTVPQGSESMVIPLESGNPTFYKVAQASAIATNPGTPVTRTVTASKMGTAQKTLSVGKLGAMTVFTGELEEDSLIPWMSQLRAQMVQEGAEVLDHIIIDGDTATGATTNINDIGGTPGGTEAFLLARQQPRRWHAGRF